MIPINVHSQNLRGNLHCAIQGLVGLVNDQDCECTAILLQDLGVTDLEGPPILRNALGEHKVVANFSKKNKSRTVAIIVHKSWEIREIYRDKSGSLVGTRIVRNQIEILLISAYLPAQLNNYGLPTKWDPSDERMCARVQGEANDIYASITNWTGVTPNWLVGGDLNETRGPLDRIPKEKLSRKEKFVNKFIEESSCTDVWRQLYPNVSGFTYRKQSSFSRLDYFLIADAFLQVARNYEMRIANWERSDHCRITISLSLLETANQRAAFGEPWSVVQPNLKKLSPKLSVECKKKANLELSRILQKLEHAIRSQQDSFLAADKASCTTAQCIVKVVGSITGFKRGSHRKGKFVSPAFSRARAEISTIAKARDLIRILWFKEYKEVKEKEDVEYYLKIVLDRLVILGLASVPTSMDLTVLQNWSETTALMDIKMIEKFIQSMKEDAVSKEKERKRKLFLNPKHRGKWFSDTFGPPLAGCPNYAIDETSGKRTFQSELVKEIYLKEGATFLQNKISRPPEGKSYPDPEPPPSLSRKRKQVAEKPKILPKWWHRVYNRNAKNINAQIWANLMAPVDWQEVLKTIQQSGTEKATGYDGVGTDLVRLLTEDSVKEPSPLLKILVLLINNSFASGKTLTSWRKAIVSMIPKRKEDGSFSERISEMRPISVLQEFGKIASKVLANRLGDIILQNPKVVTSAQRAFLKDGSTSQCLNVALNVLEDFREKHKTKAGCQLFMMSYDQVKAYDCVQAYSIEASLERFNLPDQFINYVLSNLEDATSCFKTFYGPTSEIPVRTSVRQGDPLSPLIYVFVTDALHEGLRFNPIYECQTGYTFSNDTSLVVASTGYADDTMTYAESWAHQWMMHEWVRDFCHAHNTKINAKKSKFIISDCKENDPRWLSSVDGKEKIVPLPSSYQFRYLGLWFSMDLEWSAQVQRMNKAIMDWRWKALVAKADPAQLKMSVTEWLIPKLEIGLLHAKITEKMCIAWLSMIIETMSHLAGLSSNKSLNHSSFCLLAGIPHLWLRLHTIRITELLINLNTKFCLSGKSTRARFRHLFGKSSLDIKTAVANFEAKPSFNSRANNRISDSLHFLKKQGMTLTVKSRGTELPRCLVKLIHQAITPLKPKEIIVYTDGSTDPRRRQSNSGCGVVITDVKHKVVWQGGMPIRTDGSNFMAELAAAACVIKALPSDILLTLRTDSLATIGAISKGVVSERRRVRAAGRPWLNYCRNEWMLKRHNIQLEHVYSHRNNVSPEQIGNNAADSLANHFRRANSNTPEAYFMDCEEEFLLKFNSQIVQGDPREFLKQREKATMLQAWKEKEKQGEWAKKFSSQILKQAERVWKWSIEANDGRAWIFFIFAACQWLPTNRRIFYEDQKYPGREKCQLCLTGVIETMDHLWNCPAFSAEREELFKEMTKKLIDIGLPFAERLVQSQEESFCQRLARSAQTILLEQRNSRFLTFERLNLLAHDFWRANEHKSIPPISSFKSLVQSLIPRCACEGIHSQSCGTPNLVAIPESLLRILTEHLSLSVEGNTSALGRSALFNEWCSMHPLARAFGSLGPFQEVNLVGKNVLYVAEEKASLTNSLFDYIRVSVNSNQPTRFVIVSRCFEHPTQLKRNLIGIADIPSGFPLLRSEGTDSRAYATQVSYAITMVINRESMKIDPIDWEKFKNELTQWSLQVCPKLQFSSLTDNLFNERTPLNHAPRMGKPPQPPRGGGGVYHFFDSERKRRNETKHLLANGLPIEWASLINKINSHNPGLSLIGILPNQLRMLLNKVKNDNDASFEEISKRLFWHGYSIWNKRKRLMSKFWKEIAPDEWKIHRRSKVSKSQASQECRNPFHFMEKHCNLSKIKPTPCHCSKVIKSHYVHKFADIRQFFIPKDSKANCDFFTREDLVRGAHDRAKIPPDYNSL